jgi:hypothetical protein
LSDENIIDGSGYIVHYKNQNGLQMADLIQPPANRCFIF